MARGWLLAAAAAALWAGRAAAQETMISFSDTVPAPPYINANTTWNTSAFSKGAQGVPIPTGQWWTDLADPTAQAGGEVAVNALPFIAKRTACGLSLGTPALSTQNIGRQVSTNFVQQVAITIAQNALPFRCESVIEGWDAFYVKQTFTINQGVLLGDALETVLHRGSPYVSVRAVSGSLTYFAFTSEVTKVSKTEIFSAVDVTSNLLNLTTADGNGWILSLPLVTRVRVSRTGVALLDPVAGWMQLALVPSGPARGPASKLLADRSGCVPQGANIATSFDPATRVARTSLAWSTEAGSTCIPLILTAPHHRATWAGGWDPAWNDNPLFYDTVMGKLIAAPTEAAGARFETEVVVPENVLVAEGYGDMELCNRYWLFQQAVVDEEFLLGDVQVQSKNATGYDETLSARAEEFYALGVAYRAARRLEAVKMGQRLQTRLYEVLETILDLVIYDETWKGMVVSQPGRLISEKVSHNYENNTRLFGQVLYGFSELFSTPPGGLNPAPVIPDAVSVVANSLIRSLMSPAMTPNYPQTRNFDWYTALSYSGGVVTREEGRVLETPGYALLAWEGIRKAGIVLGDQNITSLATVLYAMEYSAVNLYWADTGGQVGAQGAAITRRTALAVDAADTLTAFLPLGDFFLPIIPAISAIVHNVQAVKTLLDTDPYSFKSLRSTTQALTFAAMANASHALLLLQHGLPTNNSVTQTHALIVEFAIVTSNNASCEELYVNWTGSIPLRVVGKQLWYRDSFNYQIKVIEYSPAVPNRNPEETNLYATFYQDLHKRDLPRIRAAGFNTLRITWLANSKTDLYTMEKFVRTVRDYGLNVILVFPATEDEVLNNRHFAEENFLDVMDVMSEYDNIIVWNLESASFADISIDASYGYITLFRQYRRLRDKYDAVLKRPIALTMTEYPLSQLVQGGSSPVDIYSEGVEMIELQIIEMNVTNVRSILSKINHPVYINIMTDSYMAITEEEDSGFRSSLLFNSTTSVVALHNEHEVCGVMITEWVDQYWRGVIASNDNDCPDPSPGRHSICSLRIIDLDDGELNLEYMGLFEQKETWFRHCIIPRPSYFIVAEVLADDPLDVLQYDDESCLFIFLENGWQWLVAGGSAVFCCLGVCLACGAYYKRKGIKDRAETRGTQAGTRWLQPDISKISRIIVKRTCTLPHTQKPFERIAIQSEPGLAPDRDVAPLSGEWEGQVHWFDQDQIRDLGVFLQFSSLPNNTGFAISGQDIGNKYRISGTARKFEVVGLPTDKEDGSSLVTSRYLVDFVAKNLLPDDDEDDENLNFVGIWEKWKTAPDEEGRTLYQELIIGGEREVPGFQTGCKVCSEPDGSFSGAFEIVPQPEVDPWCYNRWQCVRMQLERLQMLIYDEMLCQGRWGTEARHQETDEAFDWAVKTLHYRYMHSFYGWVQAQRTVGGILDVPEESQEKRTDEQLTELLGLFTIWQLGEQMTIFSGHWLSWNMHYFMKFKKFPPTHVLNDGRHFQETPLTFDDITESCALTPYYDVPHQCTASCPEVCSIALEEKGQREMPKLLLPDGNVDTTETGRFPFKKTFREPRKWGVLFLIAHDAFFVIHTTLLLFVFWALVVYFSDEEDQSILAVIERSFDVFFNKSDDMHFILLVMCKLDFWLVLTHELLDIWIASGFTNSPALGVLGTRICAFFGFMVCRCRCCCRNLKIQQAEDDREISCQTFWTASTCMRVRFWNVLKLRWSGYVTIISFMIILGQSLFTTDNDISDSRVTLHTVIRLCALLCFNLMITIHPHRLHGAPPQEAGKRINWTALALSSIFWLLIYLLASVFQAWIMFRTEGTGFDFCDCDGLKPQIDKDGATAFMQDMGNKILDCARTQPRCFSAIFLIWVSTAVMFAVAVQGGFLLGVVFVGGVKHLLMQWQSRKSRQITAHKMETRFILSAINVKLLSFTDPRDNNLARKVWNKVIQVMHEEDILCSYEYETLQIHPHVVDVVFTIENSFAKERLSGFLGYLQTSTHFEETLGPVQCYPSITVVVPVYGETFLADKRLLRLKARGDHQQQSQLHFLVECYHDEWLNFVERCVNDHQLFRQALLEEQVVAYLQDQQTLVEEFDYVKKRQLKPDSRLREICAMRVQELFHTRPKIFSEEEFDAIWWWASMRMQTVARTVRGIERTREVIRFLLELEADYTQSTMLTATYIEMMSSDKVQVIIACQRMSNNKWYDANKEAIMATWRRFPKMQIVFDVETGDYRMSPEVYQKTTSVMQDLWDCMEYASCLALLDVSTEDWFVNQVIGRRLPLRMVKNDNVKWSLSGPMQGKAVNQAHCLPFCKGSVIQTVDCNQDGYFEETLKLRTLLGKFFPEEDRKWPAYKIVGHPEYVITMKSGTVGRYAGYAEYIFNTLFQRVLSVLGVRMHYGHPDYFDSSWVLTQGGLSKPNPRSNLNEDIFAGYHVKANNERVIHLDDIKAGKGRETNFDGAMGFENKLGMGAAMQYRTRDLFELTRYTNVIERHSIFFGSIGMYVYLGLIFTQIFSTVVLHIALALAGKTDYELLKGGSPYGSEWMIQVTLLESLPLAIQLILDYGIWGLFQWLWDFFGVTAFFLFVFMMKYHSFWGSVFNGSATYVATGRMDPLFRRSFRHMWRLYSHTHFMYGSLLLALIVIYMDIHPRSKWASFLRTLFHWSVAIGWMVTPCTFNPSLSVKGLLKDVLRFFSWVWGDAIQKVKNTKDPVLSLSPGSGGKQAKDGKGIEKKRLTELFNAVVKRQRGDAAMNSASPRLTAHHPGMASSKPTTTSGPGTVLTGRPKGSAREEEEESDDRSSTITSRSSGRFRNSLNDSMRKEELYAAGQTGGGNGTAQSSSSSIVLPNADEENAPAPLPKIEVERQQGVWDADGGPTFVEFDETRDNRDGVNPDEPPKTGRVGADFAEAHLIEAQKTPIPTSRLRKNEDDLLEDGELNVEHFLERGVPQATIDILQEIFDKLDARSSGDGYIPGDMIFRGFLARGLRVKRDDIEEYLNALRCREVDFPQFMLIYFQVEGTSAQLDSYNLKYALDELPSEKLDAMQQHHAARKGGGLYNVKDAQAEAYIQFAYALRRSRAVREVDFYDSTHNLDRDKTESLLHSYKVGLVLEYRGTSTTGRFLWSIANFGLWLFVFFALWQDILWEVTYFLIAFAWEYLLCLPNVVPIVILTRTVVYVFIFIRLVTMLHVSQVFFPTIFMVYWFMHLVLHVKFSFWAAYGPYILGRESFKSKKIDQQREKSLLMLLKDRREQYLFAFAYYLFCRRVLAMVIVLFQLFYCLILMLIRALVDFIEWLIWNMGKYFARKNATQTTYVASRTKDEEQEAKKGRFHFDMVVQTEDGGRGIGTHLWGEEKATQIYMPGQEEITDMVLAPPDYQALGIPNFGPLPDKFDPEQWPAEWLKLGFPNGKPADWLKLALQGKMPPIEWLKIAFGNDELPAEWLNICPEEDELWPIEPPLGWPAALPWPPPRVGAVAEKDLDAEWLKLLLQSDNLDPGYLRAAISNDLPAIEWLRIAFGEGEIPAELLKIVPPPGGKWQTERPANWPANAPWPPPKPKKGPVDELPIEWLRLMMQNPEKLKNVDFNDMLPVEWLRLAFGDDNLPPEWLGKLPKKHGDVELWPAEPPIDWPKNLPWPPPKPKDIPKDLPAEWLRIGFKNGASPDIINKIKAGEPLPPAEWLRLIYGDDIPAEMLSIMPPPGGDWPKERPPGYPEDAPWPPPKPKGYEDELPVDWLRLALEQDDLDPEWFNLAKKGELDPAEWLRIAFGEGEIPAELLNIIPAPGRDWPKERPDCVPDNIPWPPPKPKAVGLYKPQRQKSEGVEKDLDVEWLRLAFNHNLPPDMMNRAMQGEMDPADWLRLALDGDEPPPHWLDLDAKGRYPEQRPHDYPANLPWPPPKPQKKEHDPDDIPAEWLNVLFDKGRNVPQDIKQKALDGDLDPAEWLKLACGDDPDPLWLSLDENGEFPAERPANYPDNLPWPPPNPALMKKTPKKKEEKTVAPEWLTIVFDRFNDGKVGEDTLRRAVGGELDTADWLKLAMGEDPDPLWLTLSEKPSNYPKNLPWPPPKPTNPKSNEVPVEWLQLVFGADGVPESTKRKALNGELLPAEWLKLASGQNPPANWLTLNADGTFPEERPKNYPANLPWPPPKPPAISEEDVPLEWLKLGFDQTLSNTVKQRMALGDLSPAEWLKLAMDGKVPPAHWLKVMPDDQFPKERPKGYPADKPWPPPLAAHRRRSTASPLPVEWLGIAFQKDVDDKTRLRAMEGDLSPAEWLKLALDGEDLDPNWLNVTTGGSFPSQRPANYPTNLPWPPPKPFTGTGSPRLHGGSDDVPIEWLQLALDNAKKLGLTPDTMRKALRNELDPADWLRIALDGKQPDPTWLALGPDGKFPKTRPKGYPANLPWPPPQPKPKRDKTEEEQLEVEWLKLAYQALKDGKITPKDLERAVTGRFAPRDWVKLVVPPGVDPPCEWLTLDGNGRYPKERPANYPATALWPPPRSKNPDNDLLVEWLQHLVNKQNVDPEVLKRAKDGILEPQDWLRLALNGREPPPEWLKLQKKDGSWPVERPVGYPENTPWPPPRPIAGADIKKRELAAMAKEKETAVEWLNIALERNVNDDLLRRAKNCELLPVEWFRIALGKDPPAEWLKLQKQDGSWPEERPAGYPSTLPWPPPQMKVAKGHKRRGKVVAKGQGVLAGVDVHLGDDPNKTDNEVPIEWLKLALDDGSNLTPSAMQGALHGDLPPSDWLKVALGGKEPPAEWLKMAPSKFGEKWPEERPAGYPANAPWPPPLPKVATEMPADGTADFLGATQSGKPRAPQAPPPGIKKRARGPSVGTRANPMVSAAVTTDEVTALHEEDELPAVWLNLAYGGGNDALPLDKLKEALNNDLPPAEWLRVANGGTSPPLEWLQLIPPPGGNWPEQPPLGYPMGAPWPPPKPKESHYVDFSCDAWDDTPMSPRSRRELFEDEKLIGIVPIVEGFAEGDAVVDKRQAAGWSAQGLENFKDQLDDENAGAQQGGVPQQETQFIYFKESGPGNKPLHFVDADGFQNIQEFRAGVRHFFKFRGAVDQVLLQMQRQGDFTDIEEIENHHQWPLHTSSMNPVIVTIYDLFQPRERKKRMKVRGNQLRTGLATDINRRAAQTKTNRRGSAFDRSEKSNAEISIHKGASIFHGNASVRNMQASIRNMQPHASIMGASQRSQKATPRAPGKTQSMYRTLANISPPMELSVSPVAGPAASKHSPPSRPAGDAVSSSNVPVQTLQQPQPLQRKHSAVTRLNPPPVSGDTNSARNKGEADKEKPAELPIIGLTLEPMASLGKTGRGLDMRDQGLKVTQVSYPAQDAGIRVGDVLLKINNRPITSKQEYIDVLRMAPRNGDNVFAPLTVEINRAGAGGRASVLVRPIAQQQLQAQKEQKEQQQQQQRKGDDDDKDPRSPTVTGGPSAVTKSVMGFGQTVGRPTMGRERSRTFFGGAGSGGGSQLPFGEASMSMKRPNFASVSVSQHGLAALRRQSSGMGRRPSATLLPTHTPAREATSSMQVPIFRVETLDDSPLTEKQG
ncbi:hypothetical protein DIPPA_33377 [Diplonema papillatum]|nr:hypothetical protein DIPPA_33377 [Diplonema papillatum]